MGAGAGNGPRPMAQDPKTPCNEGHVHVPLDNPLPKPPPGAGRHQVADPPSYAVTGRLLLATAGAFASVLLALVALHLYNGSRRRRLAGLDFMDFFFIFDR